MGKGSLQRYEVHSYDECRIVKKMADSIKPVHCPSPFSASLKSAEAIISYTLPTGILAGAQSTRYKILVLSRFG